MLDSSKFDITTLVGPIVRNFRLILTIFSIVTVLSTLVMLSLTPMYTGTALIKVNPTGTNLLDPTKVALDPGAENATVESEAAIASSLEVIARVVNDQNLAEDPEFGPVTAFQDRMLSLFRLGDLAVLGDKERAELTIERFAKQISVKRLGPTYLLSIEVRSKEREKAAALANSLAGTYISMQLESKIASVLAGKEALRRRIGFASEAIQASEENVDQFIRENLRTISSEGGSAALQGLYNKIAESRKIVARDKAALSSLPEAVGRQGWASVGDLLESEVIGKLGTRQREISVRLGSEDPAGPTAIDLRGELQRIQLELESRVATEKVGLQNRVANSEREISRLQQTAREAVAGANLPTSLLSRLYQLQQNSEIARSQYQTLLARLRDLETQADLQIADSRIVSAALPPVRASFPKKGLIVLFAGLGGIALGVSFAFVYENYVGGFLTEEQVEKVLGVRTFTVPQQRLSGGGQAGAIADIMVDAPFCQYSEAIHRIWAGIEYERTTALVGDKLSHAPAYIVMVSSAVPGEGKTTLATSIARTFALEGRRTLLIDCDLRKPSVHKQLGFEVKIGLQSFLSSPQLQNRDVISQDQRTGLRIIGGRRGDEKAPGTLLAGDAFQKILQGASKSYDVIVLDTPPVGPVVDSLYVAPHADLLIFAVHWATTSQREAAAALEAIAAARRKPLDIICVLSQQRDNFLARNNHDYYEQ